MKLNTNLKFILLALAAAAGLAVSTLAQTSTEGGPRQPLFGAAGWTSEGLLGQTYGSLDFAYVRHKDGAPRTLRSYGLTYNSAVSAGFDTGIEYHLFDGSRGGAKYRQHEALASATAYRPLTLGNAFGKLSAGWAWNKFGGFEDNGFAYRATAGVEFGSQAPLAFTPYVSYEHTPNYRSHVWVFGARATLNVNEGMSLTFGGNVDDKSTAEYRLAWNLEF